MGCPKLTYYLNPAHTQNLRIAHKSCVKNSASGFLNLKKKVCADAYEFGYQGSEKDDEITGVTGANYTTFFRELDTRIGRWWSPDNEKPNASESPYVSMGNNPIWNNDILGDTTNYVNEKGQKLYETKDGLTDVVVIKNKNVKKFEAKLNELNKNEKINDPKANKEILHKMGTNIRDLKNEDVAYSVGDPDDKNLYKGGYEDGFDKKFVKSIFMQLLHGIQPENNRNNDAANYRLGYMKGEKNKDAGTINVFYPYLSLKNNQPLIKLKTIKDGK